MKSLIFLGIVISSFLLPAATVGQSTALVPGKTIERKILKGENQLYSISLQKGDHVEFSFLNKGISVKIDLKNPIGAKFKLSVPLMDQKGRQKVTIDALQTGKCELKVYPDNPPSSWPDSLKNEWFNMNQGDYTITEIIKLSSSEYKRKLASDLAKIQKDKDSFAEWIKSNAHGIKTVDAGNGFEDLQPFKTILKDVRLVGLGEATHGTSEFFRMKHRMVEFLVKEMGFSSFYIEASMSRCQYINNYILYGIGDPDTATAIQGFVPWRVEEVKNMIGWMQQYNTTVPDDKKVKFFGFDLQFNDLGWEDLKNFYRRVNAQKLVELDSLEMQSQRALKDIHNGLTTDNSNEGRVILTAIYPHALTIMQDIIVNEGKYEFLSDENTYAENLMNIKLIVQEMETYQKTLPVALSSGINIW